METKQMLIDLWHVLEDKRAFALNEVNTNNHNHMISKLKNEFYIMLINEYVDTMDDINDIISQMQ